MQAAVLFGVFVGHARDGSVRIHRMVCGDAVNPWTTAASIGGLVVLVPT